MKPADGGEGQQSPQLAHAATGPARPPPDICPSLPGDPGSGPSALDQHDHIHQGWAQHAHPHQDQVSAPSLPRAPGSGSSHLGQLLAEPEVLFAEFTEGPSPLPAAVLLLRTLLSELGPEGLHVPLQFHCPGLPLGSPGCQAPAQFMVLLLQLLWGRDRGGR